jgi:histidine triad (HIT) family protein
MVNVLTDCAFCKIVNGGIPSSEVYSDDMIMAFMDIKPVNPGHVLIIPKMHARNLQELDPNVGAHMFKLVIQVAEAIKKSGVKCEGVNVYLADGEVAGQVVPHVHIHVIPRFTGDGFSLRFGPSYGSQPERSELKELSEKIKNKLKN